MASVLLEHLTRGSFSFLRPDPEDIRRVLPTADDLLPEPQHIFLEDEAATPLLGFPICLSRELRQLEDALEEYLSAEEQAQLAYQNRDTFDSRGYAARWERYRTLLGQATDYVTLSNHGRSLPGIFWLHHSLLISRRIKEIPKRLLRLDLNAGREHGDVLKYRVFQKYVDRVVTLTFDAAQRLASQTEESEASLFPSLLSLMRDNVLILTEDHISPDLSELTSYFNGCLRIDGRDLRRRLQALEDWHQRQLVSDPVLRSAATHLLGGDPDQPRALLIRPGYVSYLAQQTSYSPTHFLTPEQVKVWESLLGKLKEFEILQALRKMMVPIEVEDDCYVSRDRSINTTWVGGPPVLRLSSATRPIDFTTAWVINPVVQRYGLVYDITDFSATLSMLGRSERSALDHGFRTMWSFQRKVNRLAGSLRLRLEKYLGDGAFYSSRNPRSMLVVAVYLQRYYQQALREGFSFDRGLRLAVNYGEYRLLPLECATDEKPRYEFFGHGLVELSRLVTGKKTQEIDEFKTYLVAHGYPEMAVNKFFAPMQHKNADLVSKEDEDRRFYAYINQNGTLINEGIVATEPFVKRLGRFARQYYAREHGHGYIAVPLENDAGEDLLLGLRKLGIGKFKGIDQLPIYEVVDGSHWQVETLKEIPPQSLMRSLERLFTSHLSNRNRATTPV